MYSFEKNLKSIRRVVIKEFFEKHIYFCFQKLYLISQCFILCSVPIFRSIGKSRIGLRDMGITHVVNTAMGKGQFHVNTNHVMFKRVGIQFYGFEAMDMLNFQLTPFFEKSANFIEQALNEEGKLLNQYNYIVILITLNLC